MVWHVLSIDSYWHGNDVEHFDRREPERSRGEVNDWSFDAYLNFEGEIFLQVFDDHHKKREFDAESLLRIGWTCYVGGANIGANDFQDKRLNFIICDSFDVPVAHLNKQIVPFYISEPLNPSERATYLLVPDLQWFTADTVEYGQKATLKCIFEHISKDKMRE